MTTDPAKFNSTASPQRNPPGLDAIAYRYGTHVTVFQRLLARLHQQETPMQKTGEPNRPLQTLSLGDRSDPALALLDAWATVADVVSFYQERIANEGYLRTAIEDRSILELSRTIGYDLRPGVAATTPLVFTVEDAPGSETAVLVPQGTAVQSIPTRPGDVPQTFETSADLLARVEWNVLTPRLEQTFTPSPIEAKALKLRGTSTQLQAGDTISLVAKEHRTERVNLTITTVDLNFDKGFTQIGWSDEPDSIPDSPEIFVFRQRAALWGNNAPTSQVVTFEGDGTISSGKKPDGTSDLTIILGSNTLFFSQFNIGDILVVGTHLRRVSTITSDTSLTVEPAFPAALAAGTRFSVIRLTPAIPKPIIQGTCIDLDSVYPKVLPQSWILLSQPDTTDNSQSNRSTLKKRLCKIIDAFTVFRPEAGLTGKITRLVIDTVLNADEFDPHQTTVLLQSESLELFQVPGIESSIQSNNSKTTIALDRLIPHFLLGQPIILSGTKKQKPCSEIVTVESLSDADGHTTITLQEDLSPVPDYDPLTLKIYGNVVLANHGETVATEVLGSGDGSKNNQRFKLKKPPLTHISTTTSTGIQSTLKVYVNQVLWQQVPSLHNQDALSHCYVVQTDERGQTEIIFGDGIQGARLPTGQENVRATYRSGIGQVGEVKAGSLILMQNRPLGIREVTNPFPAGGAADRDTAELTRQNAPRTVLTLNHVVSLQDFEHFARSFAGVGKAQATQIWTGELRQIFITIADADGQVAPPVLCETLRDAIAAAGNGLQPVRVESFVPQEGWFNLAAKVLVDNRYRFEIVEAHIRQTLSRFFSFAGREFGQGVAASEVIQIIQSIEGIIAVDLDALYMANQSQQLQSFLPAELARWDSGTAKPAQMLLLNPEIGGVHLEAWV
jgi:hypothetical protein